MIEARHPTKSYQPRHVWLDVTGVWGEHRCPGLLLEWRQRQDGPVVKWEALVAYGEGDAHSWRLTTRWVLAEHVRPVT